MATDLDIPGLDVQSGRDKLAAVDIIIGTYNHRRFISQAIESALMQETDFDVMIHIADDCSTDGTQEIIKSYYNKYPDKINIELDTINRGLGSKDRKFLQLIRNSRAKYIALLEGGDYWTDPYKLQKQVDFMENHPDFSMCCHPVKVVYMDNRAQHWKPIYGDNEKDFYSIEEILASDGFPEIPSPGLMFKRSAISELPEWVGDVIRADTALHLLIAGHGKLGFLKDCMAVHRKHAGGVSRLFEVDPDYMRFDIMKVYMYVDQHYNYKYHHLLRRHIKNEGVQYFINKQEISQKMVEGIVGFCRSLPQGWRYWDLIGPLVLRYRHQRKVTYIFNHIPKTAGTTFLLSYVSSAFDEKDRFVIPGTYPENEITIERLIKNRNYYLIIGGHHAYKLRDIYPEARYITLVREPISRIVSAYFHTMYHPGYPFPIKKGTSMSQFIKERLHHCNLQSSLICYPEPFSIATAFKRNYLIGLTERFDEFIFALHAMDHFPLILFNNRLVRKEKEGFQLNDEDRELIVRCCQDDILLYEEAKKRFDRLIEEIKDSGFEDLLLDYKEAVKGFQRRSNFNENLSIPYRYGDGMAALLLDRGEDTFCKGDTEEAIRLFMKVIEIEPSYFFAGIAYNNIGVAFYQMGKPEDAIHYFTEALKTDPTNQDIIINTCNILKWLGRHEDAERLYTTCIKGGRGGRIQE